MILVEGTYYQNILQHFPHITITIMECPAPNFCAIWNLSQSNLPKYMYFHLAWISSLSDSHCIYLICNKEKTLIYSAHQERFFQLHGFQEKSVAGELESIQFPQTMLKTDSLLVFWRTMVCFLSKFRGISSPLFSSIIIINILAFGLSGPCITLLLYYYTGRTYCWVYSPQNFECWIGRIYFVGLIGEQMCVALFH